LGFGVLSIVFFHYLKGWCGARMETVIFLLFALVPYYIADSGD